MLPTDRQGLGEALRREIGGADRLHLALLHQARVRLERLVERGLFVVPMRLVEVDGIDLQALERLLDRLHDVIRAQAFVAQAHVGADLGRDDDVVVPAAARDPAADDGFGFTALVPRHPARIRVRGVDQVEPGADEGVEQPERGGFVDRPAEDIAPEGERRNLEAGAALVCVFPCVCH